MLWVADPSKGEHEVAQQHAQVLVVHVHDIAHEAGAPQALGWPAAIEGCHAGGHQPQALVH